MTVVCVCVLLFLMAKAVGKCSEHLDNCTLAKYTWYYVNAPMWGSMVSGIYVCLWGSAEALELLLWPGGDSLGDGHESEAFSPSDARLRRYGRFKFWYLTPKNMVTFRVVFWRSGTYWLLSIRVVFFGYALGCQGSGGLCFGLILLAWDNWDVQWLGGLMVVTVWYGTVGFWGLIESPRILWLLSGSVTWKWYGSSHCSWESHRLWEHWIGHCLRIGIMNIRRVGTHSGIFSAVWEQESPVLFNTTCDSVVLSGTGVNGTDKFLMGNRNETFFSTMSPIHHNFLSPDKVLWVGRYWLPQLLRDNNMGTQGLIESLGFF